MGVIIELNKMALDRLLWNNAVKAKWVLGWFAFNTAFFQGYYLRNVLLNEDVYGMDGNGGRMLKIITNLTDEEMARLNMSADSCGTGEAPDRRLTVKTISKQVNWPTEESNGKRNTSSTSKDLPTTNTCETTARTSTI